MAYKDYEVKLYSFCYLLTGDSQLAQELAIESMQQLDKIYKPNDELFQKTLIKAVEIFLNKYQKYPPIQRDKEQNDSASLQNALNKLRPKERLIVLLHDSYQMSYTAIARIIENEDIESVCHSGRIQLCHHFKNYGILTPE